MTQMPAIEFALSTRDVVPPLLRIPAHAQFIRMDVKLSLPLARKYRAVLVSSSGDQLWTQEFSASIVPPTHEITLVLPASLLSLGNYHLQLESSSEDSRFKQSADWVFRVTN